MSTESSPIVTRSSIPFDLDRLASWRPKVPPFARWSVCVLGDDTRPLHPDEEALLHPQARLERQRSFRLGRLAAHDALVALGEDTGPVLTGDAREPLWPPGVMGSISHTTDVGIALVAPRVETDGVGVDVEQRRHAPELENRVPLPEERKWLDERPQAERADALLALFSAKESVFKAFFPSVKAYFGFGAALMQPTASGYVGRLIEPLSSAYPPDRSFNVGCEWIGSKVVTWLILPKSASTRPDSADDLP